MISVSYQDNQYLYLYYCTSQYNPPPASFEFYKHVHNNSKRVVVSRMLPALYFTPSACQFTGCSVGIKTTIQTNCCWQGCFLTLPMHELIAPALRKPFQKPCSETLCANFGYFFAQIHILQLRLGINSHHMGLIEKAIKGELVVFSNIDQNVVIESFLLIFALTWP